MVVKSLDKRLLEEYKKTPEGKKREWFVKSLVKSGIPRKYIQLSLVTAISPFVIIERKNALYPKGDFTGNRHFNRNYSRFSPASVKLAVKFFKSPQRYRKGQKK